MPGRSPTVSYPCLQTPCFLVTDIPFHECELTKFSLFLHFKYGIDIFHATINDYALEWIVLYDEIYWRDVVISSSNHTV